MNKAEEYATKNKTRIVFPTTVFQERIKVEVGTTFQDPYTFAEAYHQSRVKAISDEMKKRYFKEAHSIIDDYTKKLLKQ